MNAVSTNMGAFRELRTSELALVSGGDAPSQDPPAYVQPGSTEHYMWQARQDFLSALGYESNGDGGTHIAADGSIVVTAPSIENHAYARGGDNFFVRINGHDQTYVEYERVPVADLFDWMFQYEYVAVGTGTIVTTYNGGAWGIALPGGVSYTFGSTSVAFIPDR